MFMIDKHKKFPVCKCEPGFFLLQEIPCAAHAILNPICTMGNWSEGHETYAKTHICMMYLKQGQKLLIIFNSNGIRFIYSSTLVRYFCSFIIA